MKAASSPFPLPNEIYLRLTQLRGLIGRFVACQAVVITAIWLIGAFWIFGLIDYLPARLGSAESPRIVRTIMLAIFAIGALYLLYRFFWQRWFVRWNDSSLALLIERNHPEFQSSLITTVQACRPTAQARTSEFDHPKRQGLLELARDRALSLIDGVNVRSLVRFQPLQQQFVMLGGLLALSFIIGLFQPQWTLHWTRRLFALDNAPWPRMAELGVTGVELDIPTFTGHNVRQRYLLPFHDGVASVPKGQSCQLKSWASLTAKLVPEACTVYYRDPAGNRGRANMRRLAADKDRQAFVLDGPPLESLNESLWLSITGGDVRLSNLQLQSVDAPLVAELTLNVAYPEYLQRSTKTVWGKESIPYRTGMRLPEGTALTVTAHTNKAVRRCDFMMMRSGQAGNEEDAEQSLTLSADGTSFDIPIGTLDSNLLLELRVWDTEGICATRVQQFVISSILDQPPRVDMVLKGIGTSVTENALLPVVGKIQDDHDIREAWVDTTVEGMQPLKKTLTPDVEGNVTSQLDLKALRESGQLAVKVGSALGLMMSADDHLDLTDQPHVGRSNAIQLNVVTPDQLLIVLERRELAMRARLEQIIGELTQMRDLMLNMSRVAKTSKGRENTPVESVAEDDDLEQGAGKGSDENDPKRIQRLQLLRSQQAAAQLGKSEGELRGVEREIDQINQELINNRVDSADRRSRLEDKIRKPLAFVLEKSWPPMATDITSLEKHLLHPDKTPIDFSGTIDAAILKNNEIIAALSDILKDMINIQDFNELLDMVRSMYDDEGKLIEQTKQEQKNRVLDLLK